MELDGYMQKWGDNWPVGGDFNMVLRRKERSGGNFSTAVAEEFKDTLDSILHLNFSESLHLQSDPSLVAIC